MSRTERLYRLKALLDTQRVLTRSFLLGELEISAATLKRDLQYLRDRLNAPVVFDRDLGGWRLDRSAALPGPQFELPGLWFSAEEIHALLTMQHLLASLDAGGILGPHIEPLMNRLGQLLGAGVHAPSDVAKRIRVQTVGSRRIHLPHFQAVGVALLLRQRLLIDYHARGSDESGFREVSPQRLIHYRDNWYLDAWCHHRQALRSFSVDAMSRVEVLKRSAVDVSTMELDAELGSGYGIFAGVDVEWAVLRFSAEKARWIACETWHPKQIGTVLPDGSFEMRP